MTSHLCVMTGDSPLPAKPSLLGRWYPQRRGAAMVLYTKVCLVSRLQPSSEQLLQTCQHNPFARHVNMPRPWTTDVVTTCKHFSPNWSNDCHLHCTFLLYAFQQVPESPRLGASDGAACATLNIKASPIEVLVLVHCQDRRPSVRFSRCFNTPKKSPSFVKN